MCIKTIQNKLFDVVVIGGGITGLGIALEVARNGFDVVLLEKGELSTETSMNSLRIIHGGFRYLQTGNIPQIIDSVLDQARVQKESATLVKSLPCIMPLAKRGLRSKFFVEPATHFYNLLAEQLRGAGNRATILDSEFIEKHVPLLHKHSRHGGLLWYDARVRDPLKLAGLLAHRIDREGGEVIRHIKAESVQRIGKTFETSFVKTGADGSEEQGVITSRLVINATGHTSQPISFERNHRSLASKVSWALGYNVVLNKKIQDRFAVGIQSKIGRLFFAVPRAEVTAIGTGYFPLADAESKVITDSTIEAFLNEFTEASQVKITMSDVSAVDLGAIPVKKISKDGRKVVFYGRSIISDSKGYIEVIATKYTTFHSTGRRVLKKALNYLR